MFYFVLSGTHKSRVLFSLSVVLNLSNLRNTSQRTCEPVANQAKQQAKYSPSETGSMPSASKRYQWYGTTLQTTNSLMIALNELLPRRPDHNRDVIQNLGDQYGYRNAIPRGDSFVGITKKSKNSYSAEITINDILYRLGTYKTAEKAGIIYATAKCYFVERYEEHKQKVAAAVSKYEAMVDRLKLEGSYKLSSYKFTAAGRKHHDPYQNPPDLPDTNNFSVAELHLMWKEMYEEIINAETTTMDIVWEQTLGKSYSKPCAKVLGDCESAFHKFFMRRNYKTAEELAKAVYEVGLGKTIHDFYQPLRPKRERESDSDYRNYLQGVHKTLRSRMLLYQCHSCFFCGRRIDPNFYLKYWAYTFEHLDPTNKNESKFANRDMFELMKTVPCCRPCNPSSEKRKWPVDLTQMISIPVSDDKLPQYRSVIEIISDDKFTKFYEEAKSMGLEYTQRVDEYGNPLRKRSSQGRCASFLELKLLLWKHYKVLLDDLVTFRKISDVPSPRYGFRTTIINLIKALTNQCPGPNGEGNCTGWHNLRKLCPWQFVGIHFDHFSGDGTECKDDTVANLRCKRWDRFIGEILKCTVLCAECHMGT